MKKKVLFRIHSMEMGGVQKVLLNILDFLDRTRFEPVVLLDLNQGELLKQIPPDIQVYFLTKGRQQLSHIKIVKLIQLIERRIILAAYRYFPKLLRKKIDIIPDIEIAMMHSSLEALVRSPFKDSRKINWFHSDISFYSKSYGRTILSMMKKCNVTIFVSYTTKANFEKHLQEVVQNSICIYNAFNVEEIRKKSLENIDSEEEEFFKDNTNIFLSVGRLTFQKGYDLLIEVHAGLIKEGINHKIVVIGSGPDYFSLKERIQKLKIEDTFILLGNKDNPYPYMAKASYYIQPSRYEAYPLSVREAMILEKPLISTDCSGVIEMITHNKTGYLTGFSIQEIRKAIKRFLFDPDLVSEIKINQKKIDFHQYNEKIYLQIEDVLSDS